MNRATFRAFSPMSNTYEFIERPRRKLWLIQGELISLSLHPLYRSSITSRFICSFVEVGVVTKHRYEFSRLIDPTKNAKVWRFHLPYFVNHGHQVLKLPTIPNVLSGDPSVQNVVHLLLRGIGRL